MTDIEYFDKRFDPDLTPFNELAKAMAKAFGYTADLAVDKELAQLLRLRVAQKNECSYCVILHTATARDIGIHDGKVANVSSYWESELFDAKEKAALAYADVLSDGTHKNFQSYHDEMAKHFSEQEIAEIAAIVINMNLWTRLKLAQGQTPRFTE